jgi:hypothetical protein
MEQDFREIILKIIMSFWAEQVPIKASKPSNVKKQSKKKQMKSSKNAKSAKSQNVPKTRSIVKPASQTRAPSNIDGNVWSELFFKDVPSAESEIPEFLNTKTFSSLSSEKLKTLRNLLDKYLITKSASDGPPPDLVNSGNAIFTSQDPSPSKEESSTTTGIEILRALAEKLSKYSAVAQSTSSNDSPAVKNTIQKTAETANLFSNLFIDQEPIQNSDTTSSTFNTDTLRSLKEKVSKLVASQESSSKTLKSEPDPIKKAHENEEEEEVFGKNLLKNLFGTVKESPSPEKKSKDFSNEHLRSLSTILKQFVATQDSSPSIKPSATDVNDDFETMDDIWSGIFSSQKDPAPTAKTAQKPIENTVSVKKEALDDDNPVGSFLKSFLASDTFNNPLPPTSGDPNNDNDLYEDFWPNMFAKQKQPVKTQNKPQGKVSKVSSEKRRPGSFGYGLFSSPEPLPVASNNNVLESSVFTEEVHIGMTFNLLFTALFLGAISSLLFHVSLYLFTSILFF